MASSHSSSRADRLARRLRRQLEVEVVEAVVASRSSTKSSSEASSSRHVLLGREDVGVVLRHAPHPREAVDDAGLLVAVHRAELEHPQRQLAVAPQPARKIRMWNGQFIGLR